MHLLDRLGFLGQGVAQQIFCVIEIHEDVFWFQIGMNDFADAVEVIEAEEHFFGDLLDERDRDALVFVAFDEREQVLSQDFKGHADVGSVRAMDSEMVDDGGAETGAQGAWIGLGDALEKFDLVNGRFSVVFSGFDNLHGIVLLRPFEIEEKRRGVIGLRLVNARDENTEKGRERGRSEEKDSPLILNQPHGGEVTPAQFAYHLVLSILVEFADMHRMIASWLVVLDVLFLFARRLVF